MQATLRKSVKKLSLIALVTVFVIFGAMPAYASYIVYLDKQSDGSFSGVRCGEGDMHGNFVITWDAGSNTYTFFSLTAQESASICAPTQSF